MLKIAICDDDEKDRMAVNEVLMKMKNDMDIELDIKYFSSGEDLCNDVKKNTYEILLLDILMNGIDGIETAKIIRSYGEKSKIVFISSYDERVKELFKINIIDFLDKPLNPSDLEESLTIAIKDIDNKTNEMFKYLDKKVEYEVKQVDIMYFEIYNHKISMHLKDSIINFSDKLTSIWEKLKLKREFAIVNRSYIINLEYVEKLNTSRVLMKDGLSINISRNHKADLMKKYMNFAKGD